MLDPMLHPPELRYPEDNSTPNKKLRAHEVTMSCNKPIKSVSPGHQKREIYLIEKTDEFQRIAFQTNSEDRLLMFIHNFVLLCPDSVDILLKVHSGAYDEDDEIIWKYYVGRSFPQNILERIDEFHDTMFHDGNIQLLLKNPENQEYLCFDDHGILFFYLNDVEKFTDELQGFSQEDDYSTFAMSAGHWHYRFKNADQSLTQLIQKFELVKE